MKKVLLGLLLFSTMAFSDTLPPSTVKLKGATGASITSTTSGPNVALDVNVIGGAGGGLTDTQLRASPVPVSGSFYQATQPVSGAFFQATQPVSGPLTDGQLRASSVPVSGTFFQATQPVSGTFFQATQPVSGPLTDAELRAAAVPVSGAPFVNGSGSGAAATVSTVSTITAPANAVGFVLMNLDTSTTNMRWAVGRTAAVNLGQQLQPGRDSGYIPIGANVSIIAESGTVTYDIQWVVK